MERSDSGQYLSRLTTWGQRNTVNNLLNIRDSMAELTRSQVCQTSLPAGIGLTILWGSHARSRRRRSGMAESPSLAPVRNMARLSNRPTLMHTATRIVLPDKTIYGAQHSGHDWVRIAGWRDEQYSVHHLQLFLPALRLRQIIPLSSLTPFMQFETANFDTPMPATIPSDLWCSRSMSQRDP